MKADTVNLVALFGTDRHHIVPLFQRPYVWKRESNWLPLWQDVRAAAEEVEGEQAGGEVPVDRVPRTHFLGAVVLERGPVAPGRVPSLYVIDGQQRMTTLQALIASAWSAARNHEAESAAVLLGLLLNNTEQLVRPDQPQERYKVWPSRPDRDAFREIHVASLGPEKSDEHLLVQARRYFTTEIESWLREADSATARLDALVIALRERLGLVEIQLEDHDDAQVIFETLNDRGTRLRAADLVKNTLFRMLEQQGGDVVELYERFWIPLEHPRWSTETTTGRIRRSRIDVLFSNWLIIRTASEVPVDRLFTDFRIWLRNAGVSAADVLDDLHGHARAMEELESLSPTTGPGRLLQVLELLKTTTPVPLLLHLQTRSGVSASQRSVAAAAIESFLVRRLVCNLTTKDYNRLFLSALVAAKAAPDAEAGSSVVRFLSEQTAASRYWPDDEEFLDALRADNIYRMLRGPRLRVLLGGIESTFRSDKSEMEFTPAQAEKLSVEHLLPQKWLENYPLPAGGDPEARHRCVHRLGNLTLTTSRLNSSISNGPWSAKKQELNKHAVLLLTSASVLQAPKDVAGDLAWAWSERWDEERVAARGRYLSRVGVETWVRPAPGPDFESSRESRRHAVRNDSTYAEVDPKLTTLRRGDIAAHIVNAFAELRSGEFLTVNEIVKTDSDAYPDGPPSAGAVNARLFPQNGACTVPGIQPGHNEQGTKGAFKL